VNVPRDIAAALERARRHRAAGGATWHEAFEAAAAGLPPEQHAELSRAIDAEAAPVAELRNALVAARAAAAREYSVAAEATCRRVRAAALDSDAAESLRWRLRVFVAEVQSLPADASDAMRWGLFRATFKTELTEAERYARDVLAREAERLEREAEQ
jgi:hypothetical protein